MQQPRRERAPLAVGNRSNVVTVIPLPRPWLLASAMLIGSAVGLLAGVALTVVVHARIRPDVVIALVVGVPSVLGLLTILFSGRRWVTMVGAFILALTPGWFGLLVALQVASGA
jgi:Putative holin